jgi:hypothetical protein
MLFYRPEEICKNLRFTNCCKNMKTEQQAKNKFKKKE